MSVPLSNKCVANECLRVKGLRPHAAFASIIPRCGSDLFYVVRRVSAHRFYAERTLREIGSVLFFKVSAARPALKETFPAQRVFRLNVSLVVNQSPRTAMPGGFRQTVSMFLHATFQIRRVADVKPVIELRVQHIDVVHASIENFPDPERQSRVKRVYPNRRISSERSRVSAQRFYAACFCDEALARCSTASMDKNAVTSRASAVSGPRGFMKSANRTAHIR